MGSTDVNSPLAIRAYANMYRMYAICAQSIDPSKRLTFVHITFRELLRGHVMSSAYDKGKKEAICLPYSNLHRTRRIFISRVRIRSQIFCACFGMTFAAAEKSTTSRASLTAPMCRPKKGAARRRQPCWAHIQAHGSGKPRWSSDRFVSCRRKSP